MKKFFAIFLIFFLLFGVCVPVTAAETSDILPPTLDSTYDSYLITSSTSAGTHYYYCFLYSSSDIDIYVEPNTELVRFLTTNNNASVYYSKVNASSYDSSSDNNGWGTLVDYSFIYESQFTDGTSFYYGNVQGALISSNRDVPFAVLNKDTKTLDYNGEFFFTLTPPLVVETTKALTLFQSQTIQTILILVLCGVGCLALLISLPILRKVLLRFLNK